ncbi:exported hypothetical protein [uncultured Eubacteriales bacterium]|uniref:WG repeat-containing protein n=1 Tax=uncultured Eubacteriales bacterium TaxID=172733 RepID=A0A212KIF3_9FIRM|nr:exported hypothetical protein [uncultured Eubacteriales bacterium]
MKKALMLLLTTCLLLGTGSQTRPEPSISSVPDDPTVRTDWSQLTPYEPAKPLYTRRYAESTDTLIPADDYGPLIPYLGDVAGRLSGDGYSGGRYGLMTLKGEIVTDPVFSDVWRGYPYLWGADPLPYVMLCKLELPASPEGESAARWAMAAPDGSWCTEFNYGVHSEITLWGRNVNYNATEEGIFVVDGDALVYLDAHSGREVVRIAGDWESFETYEALFSAFFYEGKAYYQPGDFSKDYISVDPATGERASVPRAEIDAIRSRMEYSPQDDDAWGSVLFESGEKGTRVTTKDGRVLAEAVSNEYSYWFYGIDEVTGKKYVQLPDEQGYDLYDADENHLASVPLTGAYNPRISLIGGLVYQEDETGASLCTPDGTLLFRYLLPPNNIDD